jgi:hypothetical protein
VRESPLRWLLEGAAFGTIVVIVAYATIKALEALS